MKVIQLEQNTSEWLRWRKGGLGSSDAPVVLGISPWTKPFDLWQQKTGKAQRPPVHPRQAAAMQRGHNLEPVARRLLEDVLGFDLVPICGEHDIHPWMRVSADGISLDGEQLAEIKCPGAKDHAVARSGKVPDKYMPQLQHALAVSGAKVVWYASYRPEEDENPLVIEVTPDLEMISKLVDLERGFWKAVTDQDWSIFDAAQCGALPDGFAELAAEWRDVTGMLAKLQEQEKQLKSALLSFLPEGDGSISGASIEIKRAMAAGSIDYRAAIEELGIDPASLECFRKRGSYRESIKIKAE